MEHIKQNKMTVEQIKSAVDNGMIVNWENPMYTVVKDNNGKYLIKCGNGSSIGLTWQDCTTLNGKEEDFFVSDSLQYPVAIEGNGDTGAVVCIDREELKDILTVLSYSEIKGFSTDIDVICNNVTFSQLVEVFRQVARKGNLPSLSEESYKDIIYCLVGDHDICAGESVDISDEQKQLFKKFLTLL